MTLITFSWKTTNSLLLRGPMVTIMGERFLSIFPCIETIISISKINLSSTISRDLLPGAIRKVTFLLMITHSHLSICPGEGPKVEDPNLSWNIAKTMKILKGCTRSTLKARTSSIARNVLINLEVRVFPSKWKAMRERVVTTEFKQAEKVQLLPAIRTSKTIHNFKLSKCCSRLSTAQRKK